MARADQLEEMGGRLRSLAEELADMALDQLRRATSGDPDSAEAGEAEAAERRLTRARRAVEKAAAILDPGGAGGLD